MDGDGEIGRKYGNAGEQRKLARLIFPPKSRRYFLQYFCCLKSGCLEIVTANGASSVCTIFDYF